VDPIVSALAFSGLNDNRAQKMPMGRIVQTQNFFIPFTLSCLLQEEIPPVGRTPAEHTQITKSPASSELNRQHRELREDQKVFTT
jgi:hypothetical protein